MTVRPYLSLIQKSVQNVGVKFEEISPEYLYRAILGPRSFMMHDVDIGLNNAAAAKIAMSKSGTFSLLKSANVPAIEHLFLMNDNSRFQTTDAMHIAKQYFHKSNGSVVLKQDNGSQGINVFQIKNLVDLEERLRYLFSLKVHAAISPYLEAGVEYRVITLLGEPKLFLAKERTNTWKHNLIGGALSKEVAKEKIPLLEKIAKRSAKALELDFCSVDILETNFGLFVLEVNDQVMLDEYCKNNEVRKRKVTDLYREAILNRFDKLPTITSK